MRRILQFLKQKKNDEQGAIVVEATISLTAFIFAILIILNIINICYVQMKIGVALNAAAKEMSQYSYIYTVLGLDQYATGEGGKSSEVMNSISTVLTKISDGSAELSSDLSEMFSDGSAAFEGQSITSVGKDLIGAGLARKLVGKNLKTYDDDTADSFLRRNHVVGGLGGLNFLNTAFLTNDSQDEIDLVVAYKIKVIKLLNIDFDFTFVQRAKCKAWGKGN